MESSKTDRVTFDEALAKIRADTDDRTDVSRKGSSVRKTERGAAFEKLMLNYFKHDSIYGDEFTDVKLWYDWYREPDTGIDIVARDKRGKLVGIQCKCWADDSRINLNQISNMLSAKDVKKVDKLILVFTGQTLTTHAQDRCEEYGARVLMQSDLRTSSIDWNIERRTRPEPKSLRPHQKEAVSRVVEGFKDADRGKLIMACGTGKTLTSLHIAERTVGKGGLVLYLVPSLSLIPQAMREWADNRSIPHQYMAVCSDKSAARDEQGSITEIPISPSTNVQDIRNELKRMDRNSGMRVVFSTYNSVARVSEALLKYDQNGSFDLILFDEAHRTTGAEGIKESYYLEAHNDPTPGRRGVPSRKRLYMTATPRVYAGKGRSDAADSGLEVYSMDDAKKYGEVFYSIPFSEAVRKKLLSRYRIVIREIDQGDLYGEFIKATRNQGDDIKDYGDIDLGYMAKIGGICKAITYPDGDDRHPRPLQRIMVFHNTIKKSKIFSGHGMNIDKAKKSLKLDKKTQEMLSFDNVARRLLGTDKLLQGYMTVSRHVDGSTSSRNRGERIDWLRASSNKPKEIRVLSNARCLQEGVDVPALDAVAFMEPRNSPIDIIQSIGRVMRKSDDKKVGYVIVPIPILKGDDPNYILKKNKRYEQVNKILRAILAHDDQLQRMLNEHVLRRSSKSGTYALSDPREISPALKAWLTKTIGEGTSDELLEEIKNVILNLGDKSYHANMGERLGEQAVEIEIKLLQKKKIEPETKSILENLHENLKHVVGSTLTEEQTVKALAQHTVMYRVLEAMFPNNHNPVADAFDRVLDRLHLRGQLKDFEAFYRGIQADIEYFKEPDAKQDFIRSLYDSFFRGADKKASTRHGIVHTPVEVVNFILDSVQYILKKEFGKSMSDPRVKVLDPFTGTGIFISQLLERNMISQAHMDAKYKDDVHASEIMLPAFYVAMSNIETSYQKAHHGTNEYVPFDGIAYMDTFDQHPSYRLDSRFREKQARLDDPDLMVAKNRTRRQGMDDIDVIIGNPPYSAGQKTAIEANPNVKHSAIENRIRETYVKHVSNLSQKRGLYNYYIKALRWTSDRIGESGVIGFIIPSAWLTGNAEAGVRACLYEEFTDIYCFDLRGQKGIPRHGRNIFEYKGTSEGGTTVSTCIVILVKNHHKKEHTIHYASLSEEEYSGEQKRTKVRELGDISNISWTLIQPDTYHDWIDQRGEMAEQWKKMIPMGSKEAKRGITDRVLFGRYSVGVSTGRDAWVYNVSRTVLSKHMERTIAYCNTQDLQNPDRFNKDPKNVAWNTDLSKKLHNLASPVRFDNQHIRPALFRPFFRQLLYFDPVFITRPQIRKFYSGSDKPNLAIIVPDKIKGGFSPLITDTLPDLHVHESSQTFLLKTKKNVGERSPASASSLKPQASSLKPQASSLKPQASSLKPQASSLKMEIWR